MPNRIQTTRSVQSSPVPQTDLSAAILAALKAVKQNPNAVGEQATALARALNESGVQDKGWEHYMLYNFKKVVTGEDPNALSYFKGNMTRAAGVMTQGAVNQALSMATRADQQVKAAKLQPQRPVQDRSDLQVAQDEMKKLTSRRFNITEQGASSIIGTLREAGFKPNAQQNALAMVRKYQQVVDPSRYGTLGLDAFQKDVAELKGLVTKAGQQGTLSLAQQKNLLQQIATWQGNPNFNNKTPEQRAEIQKQAEVQRVANVNSPEMAPYRQMLEDMKFLRDDLASRNGSMWGSGPAVKYSADSVIRQIPAFEKAIESGNVAEVKKFVENKLGDRPKGKSMRQWADEIRATDAQTQKVFAAGHAILESFGPVPYVASKLLSNVMKGQRENLPMSTVAKNTMVDLVSYAAGKGYAGKVGGMANEAMLDFARTAAADIVKDPTPAGLGKALTNGFKAAVLGVAGKAVKELSPEERADLAKKLYDIGSKLIDTRVLKPIIDDAFKPN